MRETNNPTDSRTPVETDACTCTTIRDGWFTRVSNHGCPLHGGQSLAPTPAPSEPSEELAYDRTEYGMRTRAACDALRQRQIGNSAVNADVLVSTPAPSGERVTPESLSRQVYERGEPITVEQLHALHDEDEERDIVAVTMLTKRGKPKTFRMYDDPAQAMNDATALVRDEGYSRAVIHLVENIGGSYETKATATLTPSKSTPATTAAPGAADTNQVHGDNS